jgi:X-X-X-Leu-X-X-Gly heptad repeat protein
VIDLARSATKVKQLATKVKQLATKVKQLATTFQMSEATIYSWLKQERIDRGKGESATTSQQLELAAAKRQIKQLETELAVARKATEVFLSGRIASKSFSRCSRL